MLTPYLAQMTSFHPVVLLLQEAFSYSIVHGPITKILFKEPKDYYAFALNSLLHLILFLGAGIVSPDLIPDWFHEERIFVCLYLPSLAQSLVYRCSINFLLKERNPR